MGHGPRIAVRLASVAFAIGACAGPQSPTPAPPITASVQATAQASAPASAGPIASALVGPVATASAAPVAPAPAPISTVASARTDDSWAPCHQSYKATAKDVSKDVAAMARACETPTKMKLLGKTLTGQQADQDRPQTFPLDAKANHCYRVYAQAADGIKDLDVVVKDSAGIVVGQDSTDDPSPVVVEDGGVCFTRDDKATIIVSVGMGRGAYALQIWGD
jgi:hypothetical protein